ncbi:CHASE domain-containing protein [Pseudomonas sp. GCM10022188]|uniref:CHASE domain-containing protein n=1 Tax=Pseudomonas TaxID=286 RepID=UPI001E45EB66|nr:CHASE domain-containing protein [Pseudomonas oryzagri]MCC6075275.1 CHASE domain-containing protein [Pseudomonas oryzagri]
MDTPPASRLDLAWKILAIAGLYLLAGIPGLLITHSAGYASPIWPATGVAAAALLAWGLRCWPGVWLGSLLIHLWLTPSPSGAALGALLAGATTLQAMLAAWLGRRYQRAGWQFASDRGLAIVLLAAGPLTCLLAATLGTAILAVGGRIDSDNLLNEWLLWWSGDTLGMLLFAPLTRLLWPGEHPLRVAAAAGSSRFIMPLGITATLLLVGHLALAQLEDLRARGEARKLMEVIAAGGTRELAATLSPLEGLAHFIAASREVTREEFRQYSASFIDRPAILSVDWAPRVLHAERDAFEAAIAASGFPGFRISELDAQGHLQPAGERAEYFPILFNEPRSTSHLVLGLDHAFEGLRRQAMEVSRRDGQAIASDLIHLVRTDRPASLVYLPVRRLAPGAEAEQLAGYVVGVLDIQALFAPLLRQAEERQLSLRISDITPGMPRRILVDSLAAEAPTDWSHVFLIGGRTWRLEMQPNTPLWRPASSTEERLFLGFSILTAFLAAFATLSSAARHSLVARHVAERTEQLQTAAHQLNQLNAELQQRIEERGQALADLYAKQEEIRAVHDHLLECVVTIDSRGAIQSVNPAIETLLGYRPEELLGRNVSCLMGSPHSERHDGYLARYLLGGEQHVIGSSREVTARHKDGRPVEVELSVSEFSAHGERLFIGTLRDIREQRALIASLTQAREDAEQASRAKSAFLAAMSHEIRTPMNGVVGLIDVLAQDRLTPHQVDLVKAIREASGNLLGVIDDILDFSKIEAGRLEIELAPLQLAELVDNLCNTLKPLASSHGVALSHAIAADVPLWVTSDAMRLRQILYNLIGNAIKFSGGRREQSGRVEVQVRLAAQAPLRAIIEVADNGIGIAAEHLANLFAPFTQAETSTTRRFGGSGLGLAICRRLVTLLGGEIGVASTPGSGTRFSIELPLLPASAPAVADDSRPPSAGEALAPALPGPQAPSRRRILVVEDDTLNRKVIQQQLALLGYRFEMAGNGAEALAMWRAGDYDLILSDLHMPVMDGYQLAELVRREEAGQRRIPILALTANALRGEAARAHDAGMDEYLTKPIRLATLQASLERWLPGAVPLRATAAQESPGQPAPLFNPAALTALVGDDREMIGETLGDYAEALASLAGQLLEAFADDDLASVGALAHRLKSSSRAVGAARLGQLCATLEQAVKNGDGAALRRGIDEFAPLCTATAAGIGQLLETGNPA